MSYHYGPQNQQLQQKAEEPLLINSGDLQELHVDTLSGDQNAHHSTPHSKHNKANFVLSVCILVKCTIGAGILSLPYVVDRMGLILTFICYIIGSSLHQYSSIILLHAKNMSGRSNIPTIMTSIHPNSYAKTLVSTLIVLGTTGVCIAQILLLKQTIRKFMTDLFAGQSFLSSFFTSQQFIVICLSVLWLPLIFPSKIQQLRIFSMIGIIGVIIFLISFIIYFTQQLNQNIPLKPLNLFPSNWFAAISTIPNVIFSLGFFMNYFPIYKGLSDSNDERMNKLVGTGIVLSCLLYISIGVMGRLLIGPQITPNLLNSIIYSDISGTLYMMIYVGFIIELFFSFPVIFFSCKNNFICIIKIIISELQGKDSYMNLNHDLQYHQTKEPNSHYLEEKAEHQRKQKIIYIFGVVFMFLVIETISLLFNNVQIVFNFIGAVTSSGINIFLPNYFFFRLVALNSFRKGWKYYLSMAILVIMIPFCVFQIISLYIK